MVERNAKSLADLLEPHLMKVGGETDMHCENEQEAMLLAQELEARGWQAESSKGLLLNRETNLMSLVHIVSVRRRAKGGERE